MITPQNKYEYILKWQEENPDKVKKAQKEYAQRNIMKRRKIQRKYIKRKYAFQKAVKELCKIEL